MDFRFYSPYFLWFLLLTPLFFIVYRVHHKSWMKRMAKVFASEKFNFLLRGLDPRKEKHVLILQVLAFSFLVMALARPQTADGVIKVKNEGSEILLLVDVSRSMLAQDLRPSRLEIAKKELSRLVDISGGNRFGLIAFAGSAVLLSPITADREAIKMYIDSLTTDTVSTQGTDFIKALEVAQRSFNKGSAADPNAEDTIVSQSVLIASDGENHEQGALDKVQELAKQDIKVFTVAFGTVQGGPVPIRGRSGQVQGYLTDKSGQTVVSKVDGETLKQLAAAGDGDFYQFTFDGNTMQKISTTLEKLEKAKFSDGELKTFGELYHYLLPFSLLFLILSFTSSRVQTMFGKWRGRFELSA